MPFVIMYNNVFPKWLNFQDHNHLLLINDCHKAFTVNKISHSEIPNVDTKGEQNAALGKVLV
jgi:hypothetical protein